MYQHQNYKIRLSPIFWSLYPAETGCTAWHVRLLAPESDGAPVQAPCFSCWLYPFCTDLAHHIDCIMHVCMYVCMYVCIYIYICDSMMCMLHPFCSLRISMNVHACMYVNTSYYVRTYHDT